MIDLILKNFPKLKNGFYLNKKKQFILSKRKKLANAQDKSKNI